MRNNGAAGNRRGCRANLAAMVFVAIMKVVTFIEILTFMIVMVVVESIVIIEMYFSLFRKVCLFCFV